MPEGDTIHTIAGLMRPDLVGRKLDGLRLDHVDGPADLLGRPVRDVGARGKNLLVRLGERAVLRVHLGMHGSWHRYREGARADAETRRGAAKVSLSAGGRVFVCLRPRVAELLREEALAAYPPLARLGPDLLGADWPLETVIARARREPGTRSLGEVLLEQQVAAGIGNVFKCESLFLERVHPAAPLASIDDDTLRSIYRTARRLMKANVGRIPRSTRLPSRRADDRSWVYGRGGRPCHRCGSTIRTGGGGEDRIDWWCPGCQPRPPASDCGGER